MRANGIQTLLILLLSITSFSPPTFSQSIINRSDMIGTWDWDTNRAADEKVGVRENGNSTLYPNGSYISTSSMVHYYLKTSREVVWTTFTFHGKWTLDDNVLTIRYTKIELDYFQSDIPAVNQAFMDQLLKRTLEKPTIHRIQSFENRVSTTIAGDPPQTYTYRRTGDILEF